MLFEVQDRIKSGIGLDYHSVLINIANKIKNRLDCKNLEFYSFDIEKEPFDIIECYLDYSIDIVFLLSVCMWVKNWRELIKHCSEISKNILFETNGTDLQQKEQFECLSELYKTTLINDKSLDDPRQHNRKLCCLGSKK